MRLQARLAERIKYGAISRHLTHDRTRSRCLVLSVLSGAFLFEAMLITLMITPLITGIGHADDKLPVHADINKSRIIHINADRLISNIEDGWAQFTGNVCVTRESLNPTVSKFIIKN